VLLTPIVATKAGIAVDVGHRGQGGFTALMLGKKPVSLT
jgi:hypothetical protein